MRLWKPHDPGRSCLRSTIRHHVTNETDSQNAGALSPDQIADPKHPCQGAVPQMHSHFFTADGQFGSKDHQGDQVDDGTYKIVDDRTFVVSKEFPDVTFHYRVTGDTSASIR
jgi:hypothetical protein